MKRILLYTLEYPPDRGGIASYLYSLHHALPNVVVVRARLGKFWPRWARLIFELIRLVKREAIACVAVSHVLPVGYAALVVKWFLHRPYMVFVHGLDVRRAERSFWKRWWLGLILKNAEQVIANSEYTKSLLVPHGLAPASLIVIIPCLDGPLALAPLEGGMKKGWTLLSVGRLVARKNHRAVLKVLPELIKQFPDLKYIIAGDGPEHERLSVRVRELHLESQVTFRGAVSDDERAKLFQECDVFVLPVISEGDDVEGFGIVFLEAASFGKPVVAGRGGGVDEAVVHGVTGMLVDPKNTDELRDALTRLFLDRGYADTLGRAGRVRVEQEYLCVSRIEQLKKIYD